MRCLRRLTTLADELAIPRDPGVPTRSMAIHCRDVLSTEQETVDQRFGARPRHELPVKHQLTSKWRTKLEHACDPYFGRSRQPEFATLSVYGRFDQRHLASVRTHYGRFPPAATRDEGSGARSGLRP